MKKLLDNKWWYLIFLLILFGFLLYLKTLFPDPYYEPGFINRLTDRSQYFVRELLDNNFHTFSVMLDEVRTNFNTFYLIIISGITVLIIITIQIIATITRLPIGYLASTEGPPPLFL
jgi:hypothetical protein